ncbi:MAG: hypothetical protein JWO52_3501, partial [Gammaproteobacteria bacterium]|nr:hypothetical protein [Gammaproteobacteria bacterium]
GNDPVHEDTRRRLMAITRVVKRGR